MTYAEVTQFGNSEQIHFLESADPVVSDGQLLIEIQSAAQDDFAARKTTGKVILKPFE
jgi:hypothetical protein